MRSVNSAMIAVASVVLSISIPNFVSAHSGGLDAAGCHAGSQPYHCHRAQPVTPQAQSTANGCNSNYEGCVPNASDVDCAGGSGNGPEYVSGPIRVIGTDVYGLDRDGDGYACN